MSLVYSDTRLGKMWVDDSAPFTIGLAETTVLQFNSATAFPAGTLAWDSIFKYYSTDAGVSTQYAHLNFELQAGATGSDWTTVKEFAREIGKDTMMVSRAAPSPTGVEGTFKFPVQNTPYYRVVMKTFGTDSTSYFNMTVGLSNDRAFRDTPSPMNDN